MAELLLELLSEEIPPRMQAGAAAQLERAARERLTEAGLEFDSIRTFVGPRRLTLLVEGLPVSQPARTEERKGPRLGSPAAAVEGFTRSAGAGASLFAKDGFHFARTQTGGAATITVIAPLVEAIVIGFSWPKSMTWAGGTLRWVRPLRRILCLVDGVVAPVTIDGLVAGELSEGHRFMVPDRVFRVRRFADYEAGLATRFVELSAEARRTRIAEGARALCLAKGLELVEDPGLLDEAAGMVEWPVPFLGAMDAGVLDLPAEVIRTTLRTHQRCFAVARDGALTPHFVGVANIEAADGGALIAIGAARVIAARLADARFFWDEDRKVTLESRLPRLDGVVFHDKLGTMRARARRLEATAAKIAPLVGAEATAAATAARLAKADLVSAMVGEFPELQGVMGGHYARAEGLPAPIAEAIADHYRPQGPSDRVPNAPVTLAVALADKLDTIVAFFAIGERPTGSRDPYALRRAALGVIRMVLENRIRASLADLALLAGAKKSATEEIIDFFADRLAVLLRDEGKRHDLVAAVFALGDDDLVRVVDRIEALAALLATPSGADLLAGFRRAGNILAAEAKKGPLPKGDPAADATAPAEERALLAAALGAEGAVAQAIAAEDFAAAMEALAKLRAPVDAFFERVLVNSEVAAERDARLRLLALVRRTMSRVADFARLAG